MSQQDIVGYTEAEQSEFLAALDSEDELGLVVRAHIHVEAVLNRLIDLLLVEPSALKKMNLDYSQKVHLSVALGLEDVHAPPLLMLGTIRNAFAHRPGTKLGKDKVDAFYKSFKEQDRQLVLETYGKTKRHLPNSSRTFRELPLKVQFSLLAVGLRACLISAIREVNQRGRGG